MGHGLIAAGIASVIAQMVPAAVPRLPDADPAIWVVNDEDTTIFLFGTFHALDGRSDWFNDEVVTAFVSSDELVLETLPPNVQGEARRPPAPDPQHVRSLAVASSGSFLAATRQAISAGRSRGLKVGQGADMVLRRAAEASGKPVGGLENFNEQLRVIGRLGGQGSPRGQQSAAARHQLGGLMTQLQAAWNRGEQGMFVAMLNQMRASSPETYRTMFVERNANWATWIAQRLEEPGTVFVAIGAGHLAGRDSVQAKLSRLGVKSARIN